MSLFQCPIATHVARRSNLSLPRRVANPHFRHFLTFRRAHSVPFILQDKYSTLQPILPDVGQLAGPAHSHRLSLFRLLVRNPAWHLLHPVVIVALTCWRRTDLQGHHTDHTSAPSGMLLKAEEWTRGLISQTYPRGVERSPFKVGNDIRSGHLLIKAAPAESGCAVLAHIHWCFTVQLQ